MAGKHLKKWVAALITVMLLASVLTGCQTSGTNQGTSSGAATVSSSDGRAMKGNMYLAGLPILKDKVTYNVLITYSLNTIDPNEMGLYKQLNEQSNVDVHYEFVLPTAASERKATMFASGEYTDAIAGDILNDADVATYGPQGVLVSWAELIDSYMPRFKAILASEEKVGKVITAPDGNIYSLPMINYRSTWPDPDHYASDAWNINKKWLENLDLDMPTDTEELYTVLKAFKDEDANGNGDATDEIPMTFLYSENDLGGCLMPAFGFCDYSTNHIDVIDGKAVYTPQLDAYKDAVVYLNRLYEEGLIDPEAFTMDTAKYTAKIAQAEPTVVGVFSAFSGAPEAGETRIVEEFDDILPLNGVSGQLWGRVNGGVWRHRFAITSACENPEVLARWADELFDPEISVQVTYGLLGKELEKTADGKYKQTEPPAGVTGEEWLRTDTTRNLPYALLDADSVVIANASQIKLNKSVKYKDYVDPEIYPLVFMTVDETSELTRLETSLNTYANQKIAEWITGASDVGKDWSSFQEELKKMSVERVIEIRQAAMDRYNGK